MRFLFTVLLSLFFTGSAFANDKVDICHKKGNGTWNLIHVSVNAVPAHKAHGDSFPDCSGVCGGSDMSCSCQSGAMECSGNGFLTCETGNQVYRECSPGTVCRQSGEVILCDWPQ